eukprot:1886375-Pyramimonas_sp.AAC.2
MLKSVIDYRRCCLSIEFPVGTSVLTCEGPIGGAEAAHHRLVIAHDPHADRRGPLMWRRGG